MIALFFIFVGSVFFLGALTSFSHRRKIMDIPSSTIDSAASGGLVEINGTIVGAPENFILSALSKKACTAIRWDFQEYVKTGGSSIDGHASYTWITAKRVLTSDFIYINDGGVKNIAIDLKDIYIEGRFENTETKIDIDNIPEEFISFYKPAKGKWRVLETCYTPGQKIYAIGHASHIGKQVKEKKVSRHSRIIKTARLSVPNTNSEARVLNPIKFHVNLNKNNDVEKNKVHLIISKSEKNNRFFGIQWVHLSFDTEINLLKTKMIQAYFLFSIGALMLGYGGSLIFK